MGEYRIAKTDQRQDSMGLTKTDQGLHWCAEASGESIKLHLYRKGKENPEAVLAFDPSERTGDIWNLTVESVPAGAAAGGKSKDPFSDLEYCYEIDGKLVPDPYGRMFTGHERWGDLSSAERPLRTPVLLPDFDWEGDRNPETAYEDSVIYRAHVRGITKHTSSQVKEKGTFRGLLDKISYLKDLGITALELMPVYEFSEVMIPEKVEGDPFGVDKPTGKLNYWGYVPGYYFAPKAAYSAGREKNPVNELKALVKALHREGLEIILELYFTGLESPSFVLDVVRFWVLEYHVDGIHLVGNAPLDLIGRDPYLTRTKLFAPSWNNISGGRRRHLAECNDGFMIDMRQVLKGDENKMNDLIFRTRKNPSSCGVINYMAYNNGFTLMDLVSYDGKHNEANGENNQDGTSWNYSWNCGVEGPSRKKKVAALRKKQLRNAFLLLFLSQGTPMIQAGDEFGNSQSGNNNAYCQDNEISWLNWNLLRANRDLYDFVKAAIAFRRAHPIFHMPEELKIMDYLSCGQPDVSYHGVKAWCPEFESFRRQLGILYCGEYKKAVDGTPDNSFYAVYNMHWEPHEFDLPNLPKKQKWYVALHTDHTEVNGIYPVGEEILVTEKHYEVAARSIVVFIGKKDAAGKGKSK